MNELPFSFSKIKEKKEKNTSGSTPNNRKNKTTAS
jgi:hypothetical protein